jgi:hypothetical protein
MGLRFQFGHEAETDSQICESLDHRCCSLDPESREALTKVILERFFLHYLSAWDHVWHDRSAVTNGNDEFDLFYPLMNPTGRFSFYLRPTGTPLRELKDHAFTLISSKLAEIMNEYVSKRGPFTIGGKHTEVRYRHVQNWREAKGRLFPLAYGSESTQIYRECKFAYHPDTAEDIRAGRTYLGCADRGPLGFIHDCIGDFAYIAAEYDEDGDPDEWDCDDFVACIELALADRTLASSSCPELGQSLASLREVALRDYVPHGFQVLASAPKFNSSVAGTWSLRSLASALCGRHIKCVPKALVSSTRTVNICEDDLFNIIGFETS